MDRGPSLKSKHRGSTVGVKPSVKHEGFDEDAIVRLADEDNENDGYHKIVPITDIWAEYWRLNRQEGWTQQRIADAKGTDESTVGLRIKMHMSLPNITRKATLDGTFDEGHLIALMRVTLDVQGLSHWLTSEQAQIEITESIVSKLRGSSVGVKPTVKHVRQVAAEWKDMIAAAEDYYRALPEDWRERFVGSGGISMGRIAGSC
jgi:hypothetical protein